MVDDDLIPMPEALENILEKTQIKAGQSGLQVHVHQMIEDRNMCSIRGYHRVDEEPRDPNPHSKMDLRNLLLCYDCEVFFGMYDGVSYRVVRT